MDKIVELLKSINYQISKELLFNYKKINITDSELIVIIYLINQSSNIYNPKQISNDLDINLNDVLEVVNSLSEKNIIKIEMEKINNIRCEIVNLDLLYEKLALSLKDTKKEDSNLYSIFETEFGRTLSPMEYQIIGSWVESGYNEELIKLAIKEAAYNNVKTLRYIETIIVEWVKKGIKTKEDVEKNRKQFKNNNSSKQELFDYDWLNDAGNN